MESASEYLLLFRGSYWQDENLSAEQLETALGEFMGWLEELKSQGKVRGANPLMDGGKMVTGDGTTQTVLDGPFAESKEAVGGYFLIAAADMDEAVAIARGCPTLKYGAKVEVREISPQCAITAHLEREMAHA